MQDETRSAAEPLAEPTATGLSVLVEPEGATQDVVFVHGFTGHPVRTWSHKDAYIERVQDDSGERPAKVPRLSSIASSLKIKTQPGREKVYWPKHLLPNALPKARILVFGYDTKIRHALGPRADNTTVYGFASELLESLAARRRSDPRGPLTFVAHSLGGIIVKEALRQARSSEDHRSNHRPIYESTTAVMFFGTPHGGADPRGLREMIVERLVRAAGFSVNEQVVNALLPNSERLQELRDTFAPMVRKNDWLVVDDLSSRLNDPTLETARHIANDHTNMCRFSGPRDTEFEKVVTFFDQIQTKLADRRVTPKPPGMNSGLNLEQKKSIIDSLWHAGTDARYKTIRPAQAKTCEWLLKNSAYKEWLDMDKIHENHGVLWIKGKPGSGKSTLMKFAVANAQKATAKTAVIYFFFNARGEDLEKSLIGMYRSLLHQILKVFPDLLLDPSPMKGTFSQQESYTWEKEELQDLFAMAIKNLGRKSLTCFIDALDECEEDQIRELVYFLEQLGEAAISSQIDFHVCLSSRHYPFISIRHSVSLVLEEEEDHSHDIAKYLKSALKAGHGKQAEKIKDDILNRSSGIFLWVVLVIQILNKEIDHGRVHAIRKRLEELPDGLDKLFEEILKKDNENIPGLTLCLRWILHAARPLKREELYYAILSGTEPDTLTGLDPDAITLEVMERYILSCSKGLAEITKTKMPTVQFIHESVRDFLRGSGNSMLNLELRSGLSHDFLKQCCYNYISVYSFADISKKGELPAANSAEAQDLRESVSKRFPFFEYAVRNVLHHADISEGNGVSQIGFVQNFDLGKWIVLDNVLEKYQVRRHTSASLLYILAEQNRANLIRVHLNQDIDPGNAAERLEKERHRTPLNAALAHKNPTEDAIKALLVTRAWISHDCVEQDTAKTNTDCECIRSSIRTIIDQRSGLGLGKNRELMGWALTQAHEAMIRVLLPQRRVDLSASTWSGDLPLIRAIEKGSETLVSFLLLKGADPNVSNPKGNTTLHLAAQYQNTTVVDLLLSKGLDLNTSNSEGDTPLHIAAQYQKIPFIDFLLSKGASISMPNQRGETPLYTALYHQKSVVADLLFSKGADLSNISNSEREKLLYLAAQSQNTEIVYFLLSQGANPNTLSPWGSRPLCAAVYHQNMAIVDLLLSKGADLDLPTSRGQSPLFFAVCKKNTAFTNSLLLQGANPNSSISTCYIPLNMAIRSKNREITNLLLSKGADPNIPSYDGRTPLFDAVEVSSHQELDFPDLLLSNGANPNLQDKDGVTALDRAVKVSDISIIDLLLSKGADPNILDKNGRTVLFEAVMSSSQQEILNLLLSKGANPNVQDTHGDTVLHVAGTLSNSDIVELLVLRGADPNLRNKNGRTPLSHAKVSGSQDVVELLLSKSAVEETEEIDDEPV